MRGREREEGNLCVVAARLPSRLPFLILWLSASPRDMCGCVMNSHYLPQHICLFHVARVHASSVLRDGTSAPLFDAKRRQSSLHARTAVLAVVVSRTSPIRTGKREQDAKEKKKRSRYAHINSLQVFFSLRGC